MASPAPQREGGSPGGSAGGSGSRQQEASLPAPRSPSRGFHGVRTWGTGTQGLVSKPHMEALLIWRWGSHGRGRRQAPKVFAAPTGPAAPLHRLRSRSRSRGGEKQPKPLGHRLSAAAVAPGLSLTHCVSVSSGACGEVDTCVNSLCKLEATQAHSIATHLLPPPPACPPWNWSGYWQGTCQGSKAHLGCLPSAW